MAILQDDDTRFKGLEKKIGIFVLVAVVGILFAVVSIGIQQGVFASTTKIYFVTDSGQDINERMAVQLSGFKIGHVVQLALTETAKVRVTLSINDKYMQWVRSDSKARLLKEGLIGDAIIEISPGSEKGKPLSEGGVVVFERAPGLNDVVGNLYAEIVPLIKDIKQLTEYIASPNGDFRQSMYKANEFLSGLPETRKKLDTVLTDTANQLPSIMRSGRDTLEKSKKVIDSVSRTWPINKNIEPPKAEMLPADSYDNRGIPARQP
jgi:phospholipid/cholesterol/gamma-HCH transport system substrate-binding protein